MVEVQNYKPEPGTESRWVVIKVDGGPHFFYKEVCDEHGKVTWLYGFDKNTVRPENRQAHTLILGEMRSLAEKVNAEVVELPQDALEGVIKRASRKGDYDVLQNT